jgi:HTH-type transcriptional regulator/antitoxin HigA
MSIKTIARALPDTYFELVKVFPLIHIRDDDHLNDAMGAIDRLLRMDLDEGGREYLDALTDLVEVYEGENVPIPTAPPAGVLRQLMEANGLSQPDLAKRTGIAQSTISAVLNGKRSLTAGHVQKLAKLFAISPAAFLPA